MPLQGRVPYVSQEGDPTGCWWACARMMRLYYYGSNGTPAELPELTNPDGSHKRLIGGGVNTFMKNERLIELPNNSIRTDSADDVDKLLTRYGPIMVRWAGDIHMTLITKAVYGRVYHHDPIDGPDQMMPADEFNIRRSGAGSFMPALIVRDPSFRFSASIQKAGEFASDGVTKKDGWPTGWWRVSDGGSPWYYYLGNERVVMSTRTAPSSLGPPAKPHNTGKWVFKEPNTLVITWKQVAGAPMPCVETFWNATRECERMNANSNLYAPLAATRKK